jgi:hypothetical protein
VSECDREASIMGRLWPTRVYCAIKKLEKMQVYCAIDKVSGWRYFKIYVYYTLSSFSTVSVLDRVMEYIYVFCTLVTNGPG